MFVNPTRLVYGAAALVSMVSAQTYSTCNPLKKSGCPDNVGLTKTYSIDFKAGGDDKAWTSTGNGAIKYTDKGAEFPITKQGEAPTLQSNWYIFYGRVEVLMRAAPGQGIISSAVLLSDTLDEVDWEWLGGVPNEVQTNYFGKGNTASDNTRDTRVPVPDTQGKTHNYTMVWTEDNCKWFVDGAEVRTLTKAEAHGGQQYPQTPMRVKLGNWAGGDSANAPGTIQWAGGLTNWDGAPFTMLVESVSITNFNPSDKYSYADSTGDAKSIKFSRVAGSDKEEHKDDKDDKKTDKKQKEDKDDKDDKDKDDKTTSSATSTDVSSFTTSTTSATATSSDADAETSATAKSSSGTGGVHFENSGDKDKASATESTSSSESTDAPEGSPASLTTASKLWVAGAAVAAALSLL